MHEIRGRKQQVLDVQEGGVDQTEHHQFQHQRDGQHGFPAF
ncbi:hypothetical protein [Rhodobacter capsulatus]